MGQERKKINKKPINKVEAKKRPEPEPEPPKERKARAKASDDKYISIATDDNGFREIGEQVQRGEIKWSYYAGGNERGYHYFLVIKK